MNYRIEKDSLGEVRVDADHLWGAQTQRSLENFRIGREKMPPEIISALVLLKKACALVNHDLGRLSEEKKELIVSACQDIISGKYPDEFPLAVWQTGSGTQSNMNVNEVIAHICQGRVHPNDDVNMSQSSNDTFPTAMHMAAVISLKEKLMPALEGIISSLKQLEAGNSDVIKSGRTHLMDATPLSFAQELSGYRSSLEYDRQMIESALAHVSRLAIGGTAVGTGINAPDGFDVLVCRRLSDMTSQNFRPDENKFHALTSRDALVYCHGALKALAADLMKIANDIRWMASGPRCGLGEITIPANEPGSSIMPGKVNPTQCEALTMVAVQVMGNDAAIGFAASQGNFELNVYAPLIAHDFLQSVRLLADGMESFTANCLSGLKANREVMENYLSRSLMNVTALSPKIGYEKAAEVAHKAHAENLSLKQAVLQLGYLSEEEFDEIMDYRKMI
ncbi:MAG: class II fumarate hydratase [Erysipelotrichaceae bacterium]|nr:class II fumarate hydratase [Erysipelotrichaceae bacterium]MBO4538074.1 class II fumarate hydratase [Erysipelotrichaceae bacterium]